MAHATFYSIFWHTGKSKSYIKIIFICSPLKISIFQGISRTFGIAFNHALPKIRNVTPCVTPHFSRNQSSLCLYYLFLLGPPLKFHCVTSIRSNYARNCLIWTFLESFYDFQSSSSLEQLKPAILDSLAFSLSGLNDKQTFQ